MIASPARVEVNEFEAIYVDLWQGLDALMERIGPRDWSRRHGKDWTFADVPFHLAYFDAEVVCDPVEQRPTDRTIMRTLRELNAWNDAHFAARPASHTITDSLAQMHASRARVRSLLERMTDADLDARVWISLIGCGAVPARFAVLSGVAHAWSHFVQLREYLGSRADCRVAPESTRAAVSLFATFLPTGLDRTAAARLDRPFTAALEFVGPADSCFIARVTADGRCSIAPGQPDDAPFGMRMTPETFELMRTGMANPLALLLTRKLRVRGLRQMGTFGRLFPTPKLDTLIPWSADEPT
jgi:DinB family protein